MNNSMQNLVKKSFFDFFNLFQAKRKSVVTLIIPAYNEGKRITKVIEESKQVKEIGEILVIDDGSKDETNKIARSLGVGVISHHKNLGKGEAIKTGISHAKGDILLFLDADLMNITSKKIRAMILPILNNKADFVKTSFTREGGRVTEFAVKPMMKVLYPGNEFKQPISGQFAGRKKFLKSLKIEPKWGIDISILLDAIKQGEKIVEIEIGELVHKRSGDSEIAEMSKQVMETILKKSGYLCSHYKVIFFTDNTLFSRGFTQNSEKFLESLSKKRIKVVYLPKKLPKGFEGHRKFIDYSYELGSETNDNKILFIIKKIVKKYSANLDECALFANVTYFSKVTKNFKLCFCFTKSSKKLKENCRAVHSLSDALLFLE